MRGSLYFFNLLGSLKVQEKTRTSNNIKAKYVIMFTTPQVHNHRQHPTPTPVTSHHHNQSRRQTIVAMAFGTIRNLIRIDWEWRRAGDREILSFI